MTIGYPSSVKGHAEEQSRDIATKTALERNTKGKKLTDSEVLMIRKEWKLEK